MDACEIDSVRDALRDTIQTSKGGESRGISGYLDTVAEVAHFLSDVPTKPRGTIAVSKFGHTNYIDEPFIASDIMTLQPLDEENKAPEFGLYVSTQLNVAFEYANYNDSITLQVLKETEIEMPVDGKGGIDYDAIRAKMRPIMEKAQKHVDQLVTQYQRQRYKETKSNGKL